VPSLREFEPFSEGDVRDFLTPPSENDAGIERCTSDEPLDGVALIVEGRMGVDVLGDVLDDARCPTGDVTVADLEATCREHGGVAVREPVVQFRFAQAMSVAS